MPQARVCRVRHGRVALRELGQVRAATADARATTAVTGVKGTYGRPMAAVENVFKQVYLDVVGMRLTFGGGWR